MIPANPTKYTNPTPTPYPPLTAGQRFLVMMTGGCLCGRIACLDMARWQEIHDFPGAEEMVDVLNICLSLYEQYGAVEEQGATEEAWRMIALEKCGAIPGGLECATYCLEAWDAAQKEQQP